MPIPTSSEINKADIIFIPSYLGSIHVAASILKNGGASCAINIPYRKEYNLNRACIATKKGAEPISIPLVKYNSGHTLIKDLRISTHGKWEHTHWGAIFSAYGKTPFFEHLAPLIEYFYKNRNTDIFYDYLLSFNQVILKFIGLENSEIKILEKNVEQNELFQNKIVLQPYYQIWSNTTGFISTETLLDLAMNLGPEAYIYLHKSVVNNL